jgi:hypothetical protein
MSTVIWVNYLNDGKVTNDESDKWAIYKFTDKIDKICLRIGERKLSDFHDTTDAEANLQEVDDGGVVDTYTLMAQKGKWFHPDEGLQVVEKLLNELRERPVRFGLVGDKHSQVIEELEECVQSIKRAKQEGALFHFGVVL